MIRRLDAYPVMAWIGLARKRPRSRRSSSSPPASTPIFPTLFAGISPATPGFIPVLGPSSRIRHANAGDAFGMAVRGSRINSLWATTAVALPPRSQPCVDTTASWNIPRTPMPGTKNSLISQSRDTEKDGSKRTTSAVGLVSLIKRGLGILRASQHGFTPSAWICSSFR